LKPLETILAILLVLVLSKTATADYMPDIYAVVKIEMTNGEIFEGMVQVAPINVNTYHPNGLAYVWKEGMTPVPSFFKLPYLTEFKNTFFRVYHIQNETYGNNSSPKIELDSSGNDLLLTSEILHQSKYRLTDTMQVFTEIDFWQRPDTSTAVSINVNDIFRLKLIDEPNEKWNKLIDLRRQEYENAVDANPANYSGDFFEPSWYHNLSRELKAEFNEYFGN
jgi:hypothetical protein